MILSALIDYKIILMYSTGDAMNAVIAAIKVMEDDPGNQACHIVVAIF